MAQRVFVHVGSPKTGTTFLQDVLWAGRDTARAQGLLLPLGSFHDHYLANLDVREQLDRPNLPARAVGIWQRLADEVDAWPGDALVSHELLAGATAEQAARAIAMLGASEVHVVVTARDLERQIPAEWQEHIKHKSAIAFPEFVHALRTDGPGSEWFWTVQDYAGVCRRWGATLPPAHTHVVTVPPRSAEPGLLWRRFATLLGLDPTSFTLESSRSNTSLTAESSELLRRVNAGLGDRLPMPGSYPQPVKDVLAQQVLAGRAGAPIALLGADREFAITRSQRIADELVELGVAVVGDLRELVPDHTSSPRAGSTDHPERTSETVLLDESIEAMSGLLVHLGSEQDKRAAAEHDRGVLGSELSRARGEVAGLTARLAEVEAERDRLSFDRQHRPLHTFVFGMSERFPLLMSVRVAYWRTMNLGRRVIGKARRG